MNEQHVLNTDPGRILLCAADADDRQRFRADFALDQFHVLECESLADAARFLLGQEYDLCLLGPSYGSAEVDTLADQLHARERTTQLVHLRHESVGDENTDPSVHRVVLPQTAAQIRPVLMLACHMARSLGNIQRLRRQLQHRLQRELLGTSAASQRLRDQILSLADRDDPVLIRGEQGSGVSRSAQAMHDVSRRAHRPFIKLRCGILSSEAIEAELFGRVENTPRGIESTEGHPSGENHSEQRRVIPGLLELSEGGTLLLQDVEALSQPLQKKVLRMFQEKRYIDPATGVTRRLNIRLLATSHADDETLNANALLNADGGAGLPFATIEVAALKERTEDIGLLTEHYLNSLAMEEGRPPKLITHEALVLLKSHEWPGNIRQLHHVLDRACNVDPGTRLTAELLRPWMEQPANILNMESFGMSLKDMERKLIEATFTRYGGNRERTAQALQIGLRTLSGKLREYGYPPRGGPGSNRAQSPSRAA